MNDHSLNSFSFQRLRSLLLIEITKRMRGVLLTSLVLAALIVIASLARGDIASGSSVLAAWMGPTLLIWGLIEAGTVFNDMHGKTSMPAFLLLPASAFEKTVAKFLLVTLVFGLYMLLFGVIVSLLCAFASFAILGQAGSPPAIFENGAGSVYQPFLVSQSVFFLGAAWFRKNPIVKTMLSNLAFTLVFAVFAGLAFKFALLPLLSDPHYVVDFDSFLADHSDTYWMLAKSIAVAASIIIPVVSLALAWLRVREVQLSEGV